MVIWASLLQEVKLSLPSKKNVQGLVSLLINKWVLRKPLYSRNSKMGKQGNTVPAVKKCFPLTCARPRCRPPFWKGEGWVWTLYGNVSKAEAATNLCSFATGIWKGSPSRYCLGKLSSPEHGIPHAFLDLGVLPSSHHQRLLICKIP